jgi:hypothetical protein
LERFFYTVNARVVVFIKDNSFTNIICNIYKKRIKSNKHLTTLLNNTIKHSQFPNRLKEAQVVPLHKKNDPLDKENYRPVSIPIFKGSQ